MIRIVAHLFLISLIIACGKAPNKSVSIAPDIGHGLIPPGTSSTFPLAPPIEYNERQGTQDTGGGDTVGSTETYVRNMIENTLLLKHDLESIIRMIGSREIGPKLEREFLEKWKKTYLKSKINLERVIKNIKISNICLDKNNNIKHGSVTENTINAQICIGIKSLEFIPPEALKKQIHSLLIHEISHMLNYSEKDATKIQTILINEYDEFALEISPTFFIKESFIHSVTTIKKAIKAASELPNEYFTKENLRDPNNKKILPELQALNHYALPSLTRSASALQDILAAESHQKAQDLNATLEHLEKFKRLPYRIDAIYRLQTEDDVNTFNDPVVCKKDGSCVGVKNEFRKIVKDFENIDYVGLDWLRALWEREFNRVPWHNY